MSILGQGYHTLAQEIAGGSRAKDHKKRCLHSIYGNVYTGGPRGIIDLTPLQGVPDYIS